MKIINFGSLNIDKVYNVNNFVVAGETIASNSMKLFPGGKGLNQTIAIARAGGEVYHAGAVGYDGQLLEECLKKDKVKVDYLQKLNEPSGHAIIQVTREGENAIIVDSGANGKIDNQYVDKVLMNFNRDDLLLIQNEVSNVGYIIKKAHELGLTIIFNPSPITREVFSYPLALVDIFILNEIEGEALTKEENPINIVKKLHQLYPKAKIILTLGEKGSIYKNGEDYQEFGIYKNKVVDTTAAGDTFCGYFITCLSKNIEPALAMKYASGASSIAISKEGASSSIPYMEEVQDFINKCEN